MEIFCRDAGRRALHDGLFRYGLCRRRYGRFDNGRPDHGNPNCNYTAGEYEYRCADPKRTDPDRDCDRKRGRKPYRDHRGSELDASRQTGAGRKGGQRPHLFEPAHRPRHGLHRDRASAQRRGGEGAGGKQRLVQGGRAGADRLCIRQIP